MAPKMRLRCFQIESMTFSPGRSAEVSILGSLKVPIKIANSTRATLITVYGILTEAASCTRYACSACGASCLNCSTADGEALGISRPPIFGGVHVARDVHP